MAKEIKLYLPETLVVQSVTLDSFSHIVMVSVRNPASLRGSIQALSDAILCLQTTYCTDVIKQNINCPSMTAALLCLAQFFS